MNDSDIALNRLRSLLFDGPAHREGYGEVTFTRTDGKRVVLDNIRVDSVSPLAANTGVVCAEDEDENIIHIPFVSHWTVDYRF